MRDHIVEMRTKWPLQVRLDLQDYHLALDHQGSAYSPLSVQQMITLVEILALVETLAQRVSDSYLLSD